MILPSSLIRGEILAMQVTVHNYLDFDMQDITISLINATGFHKVKVTNNVTSFEELTNDNAVITIPLLKAQSGTSVTFRITPVKIGLLTLTARGFSSLAGDTEKKTIRVKPEGVEKQETTGVLIDMRANKTYSTDFKVEIPSGIVTESEFCKIQLIGDFIGTSLNNLDKLIKIPYGCGEQNMIGVTPNIYAVRYLLSTSDSVTDISNREDLITKAKSNIKSGYDRELRYKHKDGSYSIWGESDPSGSSWLTAFVLKSFAQATEFADVIDEEVLERAIKWLRKQQRSDGSYFEPGEVHDKRLQGGMKSNRTITAFITAALLESKLADTKANDSISNAISYLESSLDEIQHDRYAMGIVSYALHLAKSPLSDRAFAILKQQSHRTQEGGMYWTTSLKSSELQASDIELTSYVLLVYLQRNLVVESLPIVKWLLSKSNSLGGYSSTQNTILALQALSEYSIRISLKNQEKSDAIKFDVVLNDLHLNDSITSMTRSFETNARNKLVLQMWELPNCSFSSLTLKGSGRGMAMFQIIKTYNLPKNHKSKAFTLSQTSTIYGKNNLQMKTCLTYNEIDPKTGEHLETGMTLIEAYLLSGFAVNQNDLDALVISKKYPKLKMAELSKEKDKVAFYLSKMDDETVCIDWKMENEYSVLNLQATEVKAYDYYKPTIEISEMFLPPDFSLE
jgi:CD109 antigen